MVKCYNAYYLHCVMYFHQRVMRESLKVHLGVAIRGSNQTEGKYRVNLHLNCSIFEKPGIPIRAVKSVSFQRCVTR